MKQTVAEIQARQIKFRPSFGMMMEEILRERGDVVLLVADSARACRLILRRVWWNAALLNKI